jgi:hypothetical protein
VMTGVPYPSPLHGIEKAELIEDNVNVVDVEFVARRRSHSLEPGVVTILDCMETTGSVQLQARKLLLWGSRTVSSGPAGRALRRRWNTDAVR